MDKIYVYAFMYIILAVRLLKWGVGEKLHRGPENKPPFTTSSTDLL